MIRALRSGDDPALARVIRTVMPEFGAGGPGFAIHDPEVDAMSARFAEPGHAYFVAEMDGVVMGGAGVAPLSGGPPGTCELQKMYLLPAARGRGFGRALLHRCLKAATRLGYSRMYLETLTGMDAAMGLYRSAGFTDLGAPLGATGHFGCDRFMIRDL